MNQLVYTLVITYFYLSLNVIKHFILACIWDKLELTKLLIDLGMSVNVVDDDHRSPLHKGKIRQFLSNKKINSN